MVNRKKQENSAENYVFVSIVKTEKKKFAFFVCVKKLRHVCYYQLRISTM